MERSLHQTRKTLTQTPKRTNSRTEIFNFRQDILTLQVIVIMDSIWSREGMDFRMMPYNSLATASQVKFFLLLDLDQNTNLFTGWHDQGCQEHCYCLPDPEEGFDGDGAAAGRLAALQVIQRQRHATSPQRTTGTSWPWPRPPLKRSPTRAPATARPAHDLCCECPQRGVQVIMLLIRPQDTYFHLFSFQARNIESLMQTLQRPVLVRCHLDAIMED